jgi:hypothetical protein
MNFKDLDPIEQRIGKRVEAMEPRELVDYIELYFNALNDYKLPVDRIRELSMFKRMQRVYGPDAGLIIKWFFYKYEGRGNESGKTMKMSWWSSGYKSWHDGLLQEAKEEIKKTSTKKKPNGFSQAKELLGG